MLVSDLIRFRDNFTEKIKLLDNQKLKKYIDILNSIINENPMVIAFSAHGKILEATEKFDQLINSASQITRSLSDVADDIDSAIDALADETILRNQTAPYNNYLRFGDNELYLKFSLDTDVDISIKSSIHRYADFHFPGMQLGCRYSGEGINYTSELVANDPLYLCDFDANLISMVSAQFNHVYNMRLRKYIIKDHNLQELPRNQFSFIFSWMFFNFADINSISEYLKTLSTLLRPGGTLMFSYNNCDFAESAELFEQGFMSYAPKRKLLDVCNKLGYEITNDVNLPNNDNRIKYISWLEIKKPGKLATVKKSQARGQILTK